jgi:hypothetical protein
MPFHEECVDFDNRGLQLLQASCSTQSTPPKPKKPQGIVTSPEQLSPGTVSDLDGAVSYMVLPIPPTEPLGGTGLPADSLDRSACSGLATEANSSGRALSEKAGLASMLPKVLQDYKSDESEAEVSMHQNGKQVAIGKSDSKKPALNAAESAGIGYHHCNVHDRGTFEYQGLEKFVLDNCLCMCS